MKIRLTPLDSLRSRHLLATAMLAVFVLSGIFLAHYTVRQSSDTATQNIANRSEVLQLSRHIRESLLSAYSAMDAFLLEPGNEEYVNNIRLSLQRTSQYTKLLLSHAWVIKGAQDDELRHLPAFLDDLSESVKQLILIRKDPFQQFPSLALSNREMRPYRNTFNSAIALALLETETGLSSENEKVYKTLVDVRHFWDQMVSNYRLYIANRLGSFNEYALPLQENGIENLYAELNGSLQTLSAFDEELMLGFETSNALEQLKDSSRAWYMGFEETRKIHHSGNWRTDKNLILDSIAPQFTIVWDILHKIDRAVEDAAIIDIKLLSQTAKEQEKWFWGISLLIFTMIAIGFVYSERVIFNPIAAIANALRNEAAGRGGAILPRVWSKETRDLVEAFSDMKMQVRTRQSALEHNSLHDELTGLPNRTLLFDRIKQAIIGSTGSGSSLAVLVININNVKEINDTLGHHIGDQLLVEISSRLERITTDSDTVSRIGGNEFAVLVSEIRKDSSIDYANKVLRRLKKRILLDEIDVHPSINIGIALYPLHAKDASTLVQKADIAMYLSKRNHQNIMLYNEQEDQFSIDRLGLLADLKNAIRNNTLVMYYQPKLDMLNRQVIGVEALLRWKHPELGWIQAGEVVSLAEQSGIVDALTRWTFIEAVKQSARWKQVGLDLNIAVNISVHSLQDNFSIFMKQILDEFDVSSECITLEITESAMMINPLKVSKVLGQLNELGVSISADDFGTGFSSLSYLKQMPVKEIKIDKSFIMDMIRDNTDKAIVKSAIGLAHNLGLKVVAEGIENQDTQNALLGLSCDIGQGYYFSKPLSPTALVKWLKATSSKSSASVA